MRIRNQAGKTAPRRDARTRDRLAGLRRPRRRPHDGGYVVFVAGALPGDRVRAEVTKPTRNYAEARVRRADPSRAPSASPTAATTAASRAPARPGRASPTSASSPRSSSRSTTRCSGSAASSGFELEPIEPAVEHWRYRNKLEYSFGERDGELVLGFHARGRWDEVVDAQTASSPRRPTTPRATRLRDWAPRSRPLGLRPPRREGALRNLVVREGSRTGQLQTPPGHLGRSTIPEPPVDLHTVIDGPPGGTDGPTGALGAEYLPRSSAACALRSPTAPSSRPTPRWPSASMGSPPRWPGSTGGGARLRPLLRDRHAGADAGRPAPARSGASRSCRTPSPTPSGTPTSTGSATRASRRRRAHRDPAAGRSAPASPDLVVVDPPRAGPLAEDRAPRDRVRGAADRLRLLQPDHARAPTPPSSTRPVIGLRA